MAFLTATPVEPLKRQYPHVDQIGDWPAQMSVRLLWERIFSLEERLQAAEGTITDLVSGVDTVNTTADDALAKAQSAFALAQSPGTSLVPPGGSTPEGSGDGGQGQDGCNNAYATGHPGGVVPQSAFEAGRIVCGTANEWPLLLAPTANLPDRETFAVELLRRMIWHLQQAGFTAGRQRNPSSLISKDKLTVQVDGVLRAYDVFIDLSNFAIAMSVHMGSVTPVDYVPDTGVAD